MGEVNHLSDKAAIEKIKALATSADFCMFATTLKKLPITCRPMSTAHADEAGNIWFFSKKSSEKNQEIEDDPKVQLFYANKGNAEYLSVYGHAEIVIDKNKFEELWVPEAKVWFTDGPEDPEVSLIKVIPEDGYYWDTKSSKLISLLKMAASIVTGKTMDDGVEGNVKV